MIVFAQPQATEKDFLMLLHDTRESTLQGLTKAEDLQKIGGLDFENMVYENACEAATNTLFEGKIKQTGALTFPDIVALKYYGIEVKVTASNKWKSTGNSILETTRKADVERIYIFFGKLGGEPDIKYRLYEECLPEIGVTHSPRFMIDMNLKAGESIFDKIGIPYNVLRKNKNPIGYIKNYYRSQLGEGEELWWIDSEISETAISPIIKPFNNLSSEQKAEFIVEAMALFPEIFGDSSSKFERVAAFLVASQSVVSSNIRDIFTAGGKYLLNVRGTEVLVPQIFKKLHDFAPPVDKYISTAAVDFLRVYWRGDWEYTRPLDEWKRRLDLHSAGQLSGLRISGSQIFENHEFGYEQKI